MKKIVVFFLVSSIVMMLSSCASINSADDSANDTEPMKLAIMEFQDLSGTLSPSMLSVATEQIRGKLVSSNKFVVIAKERQEKAMITKMKEESYKDCNDKNCQIPLGKSLSADTILRTTITFFGGTYTITSELIDLEKEATVKGADATFDGSEKSLKEAINSIFAQIAGKRGQKEKTPQNSQDHKACEYARNEKSVEVWNEYLESFPNGECSFKAKAEIKKMQKEKEYLKGRKIGNLIWSDRSQNYMDWNEAQQYCEDLTEGGFTDWRLPNIDELRTTIKNCPKTETGGDCKVSEKNGRWKPDGSCYCDYTENNGGYYSKLGDSDVIWLWSSTLSGNTNYAWLVSFHDGRVNNYNKSSNNYVRCVR